MLSCLRFRQHTHIVRVMIRADRTAASVFIEDGDVKYVVSNCCSIRYKSWQIVGTANWQMTQRAQYKQVYSSHIVAQDVKRCVNAS